MEAHSNEPQRDARTGRVVKHLEPYLDEADALSVFERKRMPWLRKWLLGENEVALGRQSHHFRRMPYAERVWLPYYVIDYDVKTKKLDSVISVSIEAYSGAFAIFQMQTQLIDGEPPEGEFFPPEMPEDEAVSTGRDHLHTAIVREKGRRLDPEVREAVNIEIVHYPFWVYYFERRRGLIDIKVLDAARGEKPGNKTRISLLNAFAKASEERGLK